MIGEMQIMSQKVMGWNRSGNENIFSREISVKVCLYDHLAVEFEHLNIKHVRAE